MPDSWQDKGNTVIGNDVWIGYEATIMPGILVGNGAIIATKSVVTKNVEAYSIVGGNPAKEIRKRFGEEIIKELLEIKWWDWEIEKITRNLQAICGSDINALREAV
ncbi:MAG: CatB-related O-acetyltransferase [Okeania sp. SIO2F4]|uniref:CatB-related O-acetyltransferase n=1 Tax=Okeania sp. SIO2F4 TaxID=2607790 RepID=UPI00142BD960|nr:CatB-related O-acetyltransferase [Okeania sp. SIO2F4]NES04541.1 CatB-related O-acetyltransferase [Okeania sp. SIO2F4]